jgi:hypothetical protein
MASGSDLVSLAMRELGKPYVFGAEGPGSFDCSGLVQWTAAQLGIKLPRRATLQGNATVPVTGSPQPGDLVLYGNPSRYEHVGIYIGGGRMIDAPDVGQNVKIENVWGSPVYHRIPGLAPGGGVLAAPAAAVGSVTGLFSSIAGDVRALVITSLVAATGLGLLALGSWKATSIIPRPRILPSL